MQTSAAPDWTGSGSWGSAATAANWRRAADRVQCAEALIGPTNWWHPHLVIQPKVPL